jgi:hypothetical protein
MSSPRIGRDGVICDVARRDVTRQIDRICVLPLMSTHGPLAEQIGGSRAPGADRR